ncbi:hypothetical protein J4E89_001627 [Alternaria sp. Ai002NY15]|nr:hypothetical protein J4E89_001627 [Alternaria sp. Ai002NY15]
MEETDPVDEVAAGVEKMGVNDTVDIEANPKPRARPRRFIRRKKVDSATSTPTEDDGTNVQENAITLPAEVLRGQQEAGKAVIDTLELHIALVEKLEDKLNEALDQTKEARFECRRQEKRLVQAQEELKAAKDKAEDLADRQGLRKTTTDIQFRKYTITSEPGYAKFDLVQTFTTLPKWGTDKAVLAYMKIGGRPVLAQSGKHPGTEDGIIDGTIYTRKACELFQLLGDTEEVTFFQHAEPQLMALYVEKFRNPSLTFEQFRDLHGADFLKVKTEVEIFVSQAPCDNCRRLMYRANNHAKRYGFLFSLEDISINQANPKVKDAGIKVKFVD